VFVGCVCGGVCGGVCGDVFVVVCRGACGLVVGIGGHRRCRWVSGGEWV
jgi:hypothetical protein